jgi:hypothetical protein
VRVCERAAGKKALKHQPLFAKPRDSANLICGTFPLLRIGRGQAASPFSNGQSFPSE